MVTNIYLTVRIIGPLVFAPVMSKTSPNLGSWNLIPACQKQFTRSTGLYYTISERHWTLLICPNSNSHTLSVFWMQTRFLRSMFYTLYRLQLCKFFPWIKLLNIPIATVQTSWCLLFPTWWCQTRSIFIPRFRVETGKKCRYKEYTSMLTMQCSVCKLVPNWGLLSCEYDSCCLSHHVILLLCQWW